MESQIKIRRDDDPSEVVEAFTEALLAFGIVCGVVFDKDEVTITLKEESQNGI